MLLCFSAPLTRRCSCSSSLAQCTSFIRILLSSFRQESLQYLASQAKRRALGFTVLTRTSSFFSAGATTARQRRELVVVIYGRAPPWISRDRSCTASLSKRPVRKGDLCVRCDNVNVRVRERSRSARSNCAHVGIYVRGRYVGARNTHLINGLLPPAYCSTRAYAERREGLDDFIT